MSVMKCEESAVTWSDSQRQAIEARRGEILVSAGAGSGKTSVLVERLIQLITDEHDPVDIEQILAVTFTEEAAAQMRRRIDQAIRKKLEIAPNARLEKQLALIERSWICTVDAFCLRLVQENFQTLSVDPRFRVLGEDEARLLKLEVAERMFDSLYERDDDFGGRFHELVECYGGAGQDGGLQQTLLNLHNILETVLEPKDWLRNAARQYENISALLEQWRSHLIETYSPLIDQYESAVNELIRCEANPVVVSFARDELRHLRSTFAKLANGDAEKALSELRPLEWGKLPGPKKSEHERQARDEYKSVRDSLKEDLADMVAVQPEEVRRTLENQLPFVKSLSLLAMNFRRLYRQEKRAMSAMDFADMERGALRLMRNAIVRARYRERFQYVIIDEYQDINPLQDEILHLIARENPSNCFMVGDVKQCIYGFRLAEPGLFIKKAREFSTASDAAQRIIFLPDNYRSREEVVDAVNTLFERIFDPCLKGITYQDGDRLKYGADYDLCPMDNPVELALLDCGDGADVPVESENGESENAVVNEANEYSNLECQALEIGRRVLEWTGRTGAPPLMVKDGATKQMRPVRLSDMAILMRAAAGSASVVMQTLNALGIPVVTSRETTFFESMEVMDVFSLLHVLDNPRQDIHLAAVLRSPFYRFDENDLAEIRCAHPDVPFHEAVILASSSGLPSELQTRLTEALAQLERWRTRARSKPLADVLNEILDETGYADFVLALRGGEQRRARVEAIVDRARQFESFGRPTLYRFLRFIEDLAKRAVDIKAPPPPSAGGSLRLMTIHQSKGLEFPVVFVPQLEKKFNFMDARSTICLNRSGGIGMVEVWPEYGVRRDTIMRHLINKEIELDARAEEARLLYVAMTRAKERLVMLASAKFDDNLIARWTQKSGSARGPLSRHVLTTATNCLEWIGPAISPMPLEINTSFHHRNFRITCSHVSNAGGAHRVLADAVLGMQDSEKAWVTELRETGRLPLPPKTDGGIAKRIGERIAWTYPYRALAQTKAKWSVSDLKSRQDPSHEEGESLDEMFPQPAATADLSARERGILFHSIMQRLELDGDYSAAGIAAQVARMIRDGQVSPKEVECIDLAPIVRFFGSELGQWFVSHRATLRRETPFCLSIPAAWAQGDANLADEERVVVQGVIDALIETPEGYWIVDYKTDSIDAKKMVERAEEYVLQMALYAQAVKKILRKPVEGAMLVFLTLGDSVVIPSDRLMEWKPDQKLAES